MVWATEGKMAHLGIGDELIQRISNAKPKTPVIANWMTEQNRDQRVIGIAQMGLESPSKSNALKLSEKVTVNAFMYNFPRAGGLIDIGDDSTVASATNIVHWSGVVPLSQSVGLGLVQVTSPENKSVIEVTVPILADKIVEENVSSAVFTQYFASIARYIICAASGVDQIVNWQNSTRLLQVGWVETWEPDEWSATSGSAQMYAGKDVPQRALLDVVNQYVQTDSVARVKTGATLRQSDSLMKGIAKIARDYLGYEYRHHHGVSVASIGSPKDSLENNWLNMTVTELIDFLTARQRAHVLGPAMGAVATEAGLVHSAFSNMISTTGREDRSILKAFNGHFHGFWSGLSAKVGLDYIYKAIPWSADREMTGYWLDGLRKINKSKNLLIWE